MSRDEGPRRIAFVFNANAKSVTKSRLNRLSAMIPRDDLFISHSLGEAKDNLREILERGYSYVFCGGGDGTAIFTINQIYGYHKENPHLVVPAIGVLALGTGNALARLLSARSAETDVKRLLFGKPIAKKAISMIEASAGHLTPFAGIGYDGELMNDFEAVKDVFFESPFRKFFSSVLGFTIAGFFRTLPRQIARRLPAIRVNSSHPAYRIMEINGVDEEIYMEEGQLLYDGPAPLICVGTVPWVGYGLTLFPFANKRPGYMHLRISAVPLSVSLTNLYPSIWHGHFRHHKLFDFLVKDVTIESEESLPYQIGGDAMGYKKKLYFRVAKNPITMVSLHPEEKRIDLPPKPLMLQLI